MPFVPAILLTDWLVYFILTVVVAFALYARRHEHLRAPWRRVTRRPLAMSALVVLLVYVGIGLLDSTHFRLRDTEQDVAVSETRYSHEVLSVLDILLKPLRESSEKTYSAPFAVYAYTRETIVHADGSTSHIYPRLQYAGAHLHDASERPLDIAKRVAVASIQGTVIWIILLSAFAYFIARRKKETFGEVLHRLRRGQTEVPWRTILLTVGVLLILVFCALHLAPYYHLFGSDQVGRDVLYKSLKSIRTGLLIGTLTTLVMLPFAIMLGIMAGYFRSWADDIIQYVYTTLSSIPGVLLIAAAILSLQVYMANHPEDFNTLIVRSDTRLLFLCLILGVTSWTSLCRLLRGETLKLREVDYVQAAVALGARHTKIMMRHIFPNVMHIVLITVVLDFSGLVLAEAVLSYVGVGVDPTMDSWGNMINGARLEMAREPIVWWNLAAAFVFMFGLVLAANLFSDAVRDAFDPRLRR